MDQTTPYGRPTLAHRPYFEQLWWAPTWNILPWIITEMDFPPKMFYYLKIFIMTPVPFPHLWIYTYFFISKVCWIVDPDFFDLFSMSQIICYAFMIWRVVREYCCPCSLLTSTAGHALTYKATKETKVAQRSVGMSSTCRAHELPSAIIISKRCHSIPLCCWLLDLDSLKQHSPLKIITFQLIP